MLYVIGICDKKLHKKGKSCVMLCVLLFYSLRDNNIK